MIPTGAPSVKSTAPAKLEFEKKQLKKVCEQFGALLTDQLLHAMRAGTIRAEQPGESQQIYESMFDQTLALEMSKHQTGGIASLLYKQLLPLIADKAEQDGMQKSG